MTSSSTPRSSGAADPSRSLVRVTPCVCVCVPCVRVCTKHMHVLFCVSLLPAMRAPSPAAQDFEKLVKRIEDGEGRIQRRVEMSVALDEKVARYKNPWESLKVNYGLKRGKQYIDEEDVFLVCMTQKLGYGNWDALKVEIRKAWQVRHSRCCMCAHDTRHTTHIHTHDRCIAHLLPLAATNTLDAAFCAYS